MRVAPNSARLPSQLVNLNACKIEISIFLIFRMEISNKINIPVQEAIGDCLAHAYPIVDPETPSPYGRFSQTPPTRARRRGNRYDCHYMTEVSPRSRS